MKNINEVLKEFKKEFDHEWFTTKDEVDILIDVKVKKLESFIQKSYEAGEQNALKEIVKIIKRYDSERIGRYLLNRIETSSNEVILDILKKVQSLIKSYKVK
jgi:hypothetical protein